MLTEPRTFFEAALERLDLLLHREILRLRSRYELSLDEFRGLYVSDEQVDRLINRAVHDRGAEEDVEALTARAEEMQRQIEAQRGPELPWTRLVVEFELSAFEQDVLLLALAPEIDPKYETLYAYLNNDVSRKWPTRELALRLFAVDVAERWELRRKLLPERTLFGSGLLAEFEPTSQHPLSLAVGFAPSPLVMRFALGLPLTKVGLAGASLRPVGCGSAETDLCSPERLAALCRGVDLCDASAEPFLLVFTGRDGSGRSEAAAALCGELGRPLLRVDVPSARAAPMPLSELLQTLALRQRLEPAVLFFTPADALLDSARRPAADAHGVVTALARLPGPVILAGAAGTPWSELLEEIRHLVFHFEDPSRDERRRLWVARLAAQKLAASEEVVDALADRFVLTPGQIQHAVAVATDAHRLRGGDEEASIRETLFRAARAQSGDELGRLATRVETGHRWEDLVLPPATLRHVREIAAAVEHRHRVYTTWGFGRRVGSGRGLKVLFAGASGTGKTMTAGVIARELELDLFKIDLSGVVSKYIGETEKNLDRIFRAAHSSNAILFFDEADALFGKRSEVKDAHDRYANIEVSYLLQKMDEHEGVVILATNLRKNIDEAFGRRMHYVIEFPVPDSAHREQLWRGMFPAEAPLGDDVDFAFLARQFPLAGGDIQNIALEAAFLAAQNGRVFGMKQVVSAVARQMLKRGKAPSNTDFKQYYSLLIEEN